MTTTDAPYQPTLPRNARPPRSLSLAELEEQINTEMARYPNGSRYADLLLEEFDQR